MISKRTICCFMYVLTFLTVGSVEVSARKRLPEVRDTHDKIWRGEKLRKLAPAGYYYNSLLHSPSWHRIATEWFPEIVYVPGWEQFIVGEDRYGKKIVFLKNLIW